MTENWSYPGKPWVWVWQSCHFFCDQCITIYIWFQVKSDTCAVHVGLEPSKEMGAVIPSGPVKSCKGEIEGDRNTVILVIVVNVKRRDSKMRCILDYSQVRSRKKQGPSRHIHSAICLDLSWLLLTNIIAFRLQTTRVQGHSFSYSALPLPLPFINLCNGYMRKWIWLDGGDIAKQVKNVNYCKLSCMSKLTNNCIVLK